MHAAHLVLIRFMASCTVNTHTNMNMTLVLLPRVNKTRKESRTARCPAAKICTGILTSKEQHAAVWTRKADRQTHRRTTDY